LVLSWQSLGFIVIIAFSWLNEADLNSGSPLHDPAYVADTTESLREMILVMLVWITSSVVTRRLLARVEYLEQFMKVCAWCHQIDYQGKWISMEAFLRKGFDTPTTHGICPECLKREKEAIARARQKRAELTQSPGV